MTIHPERLPDESLWRPSWPQSTLTMTCEAVLLGALHYLQWGPLGPPWFLQISTFFFVAWASHQPKKGKSSGHRPSKWPTPARRKELIGASLIVEHISDTAKHRVAEKKLETAAFFTPKTVSGWDFENRVGKVKLFHPISIFASIPACR